MFNIYPYNYWILYAAIAALIITIIVSAVQILKLLKSMADFLKPRMDHLQTNVKLATIKMEAMDEKKKEDAKKNKLILAALPILLAVYQAYKKDDEAVGAKGVVKAAKTVITNRQEEQKFIKKVASAIR
jgi:hypothetical protein